MLIAVAVTVLIVIGIKESATVNTAIVIIKVAVVLIVIGAGAFFVMPANWHPVHSRRTPAPSASSGGAVSCGGPP